MRKFLATLMAVCMVIGITACGQEPASSSSSIGTQESTTVDVSESYVESVVESKESESSQEESEGGSNYTVAAEETTKDSEEISELIILFMKRDTFHIIAANTDTGACSEISSFTKSRHDGFELSTPALMYFLNLSHFFSGDYQKMAFTKVENNTHKTHAGWIDSAGNFFDVTEAVGMTSNDEFTIENYFYSLGFSKTGYFVFLEMPEDVYLSPELEKKVSKYGKFYYVDPNTLDVVYEGNPITEEDLHGKEMEYGYGGVTDWIDGEYYLSDFYDTIIRNVSDTEYKEEFVSNEVRSNWSGVCGPNNQIAFVSAEGSMSDAIDLAIYITERYENTPRRIIGYEDLIEYGAEKVMKYDFKVTILDWIYE